MIDLTIEFEVNNKLMHNVIVLLNASIKINKKII